MAFPYRKALFAFAAISVVVLIVFGITYYFIKCQHNRELVEELTVYVSNRSIDRLKFILQWTPADLSPFIYMGAGRKGFIDRRCAFTNCVVTSDRDLLNLTEYDVVVFDGKHLVTKPVLNKDFPTQRSPSQKYVFASMESAQNYPILSNRLDGVFNWTWTYRLDSDARWGYLLVKDANNTVIGPNKIMHWIEPRYMKPVRKEFEEKLKSKSKAAAWFVSNCDDKCGRFTFATRLKRELRKHNLDLDIFGRCGTMVCSRDKDQDCNKMISDTYYFYLAFENTLCEDYVTEKLLRALQNDAVPIVYGGANYTRFMPDGIYLNARELGPKPLAAKMKLLIEQPEKYMEFFKWKNHYSYHTREETPELNDYCNFCAIANDEERMKRVTIIQNFREWWDPPTMC